MQLLTFAHRGEARSFFEQLELEPLNGNSLYCFKEGLLLITGEGLFEAMNAVSKAVANYPSIERIINLGVAGALDSELSVNQVVQIRTSYLELEGKAQFHSFNMENKDTPFKLVDCLTSTRRILEKTAAKELLPFAQIVDRELWAISRALKDEKLPITSLKLISDIPSDETSEICKVVKDKADFFSSELFKAWSQLNNQEVQTGTVLNELPYSEEFHFTTSMRTNLEKKLSQLTIKFPNQSLEELIVFEEIIQQETRPKEKANELLSKINGLLNPYRVELEKRLTRLTPGLKAAGLSPSFDPNLEKVQLHIKATLSSSKDIDKAVDQLKKFDFDKLKSILEGEVDV